MKVSIDQAGCVGCGLCAGICGNVFALREDGRAYVAAEPKGEGEEAGAAEAAASCPAGVIRTEGGPDEG